MRFYPRNRQSRHDALIGPNHVDQHPQADSTTERDRLHRYAKGNDLVLTAGGSLHASTKTIINAANVKGAGTLTLTPGAIADGDIVIIDGIYYTINTSVVAGAGTVGSPYSVLKGASDTTAFANLRKAINATGVAGTDYSTGLAIHPTVTAVSSNATTIVINAKSGGVAGNSIATTVGGTSAADGLAWGAAHLTGGTAAVLLTLTASGDDLWMADVVTRLGASLVAAFPATDGLRAALSASNFSVSADLTVLTLTLPNFSYVLSGDASYDATFPKECFRNAHDTYVVTGAIAVTNV